MAAELDSMDHQVMEVMFKQLDADSDGKLSMNELMGLIGEKTPQVEAALKPFFEACDKDADKRITLDEFKEFYVEFTASSDEEEEVDTAGGMTDEKLERLFKSLDADSDGTLTMKELKALLDAEASDAEMQPFFDACDTDGDKRISLDEFKAFNSMAEDKGNKKESGEKTYGGMTEETMEKLFKSLDADKDGKLVMNELRAMLGDQASDADMKPFFDACDTNGDKRISLEEFKAFYKGMGEDKETSKSDDKEPEEETAGGMTEETMEKLFKSLDADKDGKLVMKELKALVDAEASDADMQPFFDACDTDGDRRISLEEFKAFYKNM